MYKPQLPVQKKNYTPIHKKKLFNENVIKINKNKTSPQREESERNQQNTDVLSSCGEWNAPEDTMKNVHPNIVMLNNVDDK